MTMSLSSHKIISLSRLGPLIADLKRQGKKVVFTNGCFDILHFGHIQYLQQAAKKGDALIVGLNSDASVKRLKGKNRPFTPQRQRAAVLAALSCVDYVVIFGQATPYMLIRRIKPDVLVKGGDWPEDKIVGADVVRKGRGRVLSLPYIKGLSTSEVMSKVAALIDANINRAKEGLRVCEDTARFVWRNIEITKRIKRLRHSIDAILAHQDGFGFLKHRDSRGDIGRPADSLERRRGSVRDVFIANLQRAKEAARVLEEYGKLWGGKVFVKFKELRFELYQLEKEIAQRF